MITLPQVKQTLIERMKTTLAVTDLLKDVKGVPHPEEIREREWRGTKFTYPCIRVWISNFAPINSECTQVDCGAEIYVMGENPSSLQIDLIASQVMQLFHGKSFSWTDTGVKIVSPQCRQVGADYTEEGGVWVGVVTMSFKAN